MRVAVILALALVPTVLSAQRAPRVEVAAGLAAPLLDNSAFDAAGYALRITARSPRPTTAFAIRADLSYFTLGFSPIASAPSGSGSGAGDVTALTLGAEWRERNSVTEAIQAYAALGVGLATGYYGTAGGGNDGRASGGAAVISLGARRAIGRSILALEVGVGMYGPVRRTTLLPVTLAWGF